MSQQTLPPPKTSESRPIGSMQFTPDVKQLGLFASIASLGYVFWVVGGMEMVERLAYYGVKAVASLYAKDPVSKGGLGITMTTFASILTVWAFFQSFVPVAVGGLADRLGYKKTIFLSTVVKISGYLTMGMFPTYWGFFWGAILLASGTAIFKPGIQGTLVKATNRQNSSMAWGIFYQTVNIGGFIGPVLAGAMRKMAWSHVFFACAAIICLNFLLLLTYREPGIEDRLARQKARKEGGQKQDNLLVDSLKEFFRPAVFAYLLIFSGFWFMFNALFDVLPVFIEEWVNTGDIVKSLFGAGGTTSAFWTTLLCLDKTGTHIQPEGLMNLNAGMIMVSCFLFAFLSSKMRATNSMVLGTLLASGAMFLSGYSTLGWISVFAIATFSVGEMLSSPKFTEFIGNFAPDDKKAMYLGFSQFAVGIGWVLEGQLGPRLYDIFASKDAFAREFLLSKGFSPDVVGAIPQGEAFSRAVEMLKMSPETLTSILHATHHVGYVWYIMGSVGLISALGIYLYGVWIARLARKATA